MKERPIVNARKYAATKDGTENIMSIRSEKVSSLLKEELSAILLHELTLEHSAFMTVTDIRMSPDLKIARVYLSIYGPAEKKESLIKELTRRKGEIRHLLGSRIRLKFTPDLQFYIDETLDKVDSLEQIFKKIRSIDK
jgi:ribosome-binding factor A